MGILYYLGIPVFIIKMDNGASYSSKNIEKGANNELKILVKGTDGEKFLSYILF